MIFSFHIISSYRCDPPPKCTDKCNSHKDCEPREGYKEFCKQGHCYYIAVGCRSNSDCNIGLTCYKQRCVKTDCSTDQQCQKAFGKQAFCIKGKCLKSNRCESDEQCIGKYGSQFKCYDGTCRRVNMKKKLTLYCLA